MPEFPGGEPRPAPHSPVNLHPASLLAGWGVATLALQASNGVLLAVTAGPPIVIAIAFVSRRFLSLLRRLRWLILTIVAVFALATPGVFLEGFAGRLGFTHDGIAAGADHLLRLLATLALLALILECLSISRLVAGLHALAGPFVRMGFDRDRAAARLLLVLQYVEGGGTTVGWRHWMDPDDGTAGDPALSFPRIAAGPLDVAWGAILLGYLALLEMIR